MPLFSRPAPRRRSALGRTVGTAVRGVRLIFRGSFRSGRWMTRHVGRARARGAGGESGMTGLFDLHAVSCAGDTLIAIGLAGTIFFSVPLGEARSKVALYLLVTMIPFALLAPVIGPLLDHFRHGRRYAMAATMLGRAFLAWLISDYLHGFGLYPAAFGVLALSRAYGVARSAAVPRLLPPGLGLSQVGARASVYGTIAGAVVAPLGLAAFWVGPQWPLRVASVIFLIGMVIALRLPARADSQPPETVPRAWRALGFRAGRGERALDGPLVTASLLGAAVLRGVYGFLLLFLAFTVKAGDLATVAFGRDLGVEGALGLVGGALATGTFLATAAGTRLRIHRPAVLQSSGLVIVAGLAVLTALLFSLPMVALLCLVTAALSGIAKLAVDATIQERIAERLRASAFAHSETVLMLAFVVGGVVGLLPVHGRIGIGVAAGLTAAAAARAVALTGRLRGERLHGRASDEEGAAGSDPFRPATVGPGGSGPGATVGRTAGSGATGPDAAGSGATGPDAPTSPPEPPPPGPVPNPPAPPRPAPRAAPAQSSGEPGVDRPAAPPGYHIYRPSSAITGKVPGDDRPHQDSPGQPG